MEAVTYTKARSNFKKTMDQVCDDRSPILITRQTERPVVMISLEDYDSMIETLYLLQSPKNAARLSKAMSDVKKKRYKRRKLIEA